MNKEVVLMGRYAEGLRRGRYFMSLAGYKRQFIKKLGIDPYHGTFNVRLSRHYVSRLNGIKKRKGILVKGFRRGKSTFGDVAAYPANISGIKCALVIPKRTVHRNVAEIISEKMLRRALRVKPGDPVKVTVYL